MSGNNADIGARGSETKWPKRELARSCAEGVNIEPVGKGYDGFVRDDSPEAARPLFDARVELG